MLPGHLSTRATRGQSLVETALVLPIILLVVGGIIQFGILFWSQNTLTQVARDTGRWAATDQSCSNSAIVTQANAIASNSSLFGYTPNSNQWTSANVQVSRSGAACPPTSNTSVAWVQITLHHQVPILLPWIPGDGNLTTSVQYRMEPISPP
jgi:Flp pilus assembly protein TadG